MEPLRKINRRTVFSFELVTTCNSAKGCEDCGATMALGQCLQIVDHCLEEVTRLASGDNAVIKCDG